MKKLFKYYLLQFHSQQISVDTLQEKLLELNPHQIGSMHFGFYMDWIVENFEAYKSGEEYRLSLTSSGGILESLNG